MCFSNLTAGIFADKTTAPGLKMVLWKRKSEKKKYFARDDSKLGYIIPVALWWNGKDPDICRSASLTFAWLTLTKSWVNFIIAILYLGFCAIRWRARWYSRLAAG